MQLKTEFYAEASVLIGINEKCDHHCLVNLRTLPTENTVFNNRDVTNRLKPIVLSNASSLSSFAFISVCPSSFITTSPRHRRPTTSKPFCQFNLLIKKSIYALSVPGVVVLHPAEIDKAVWLLVEYNSTSLMDNQY
ncbi:MAG: hypothetical protein NTV34_06590, partial [Proteobacteria bacterium]|nr:hypothetical protein [Pseudomonadota bacterium]